MKTVHKIIGLFGGVNKFPPLRIDNDPHRSLGIERVGRGPHNRPLVSVSHSSGLVRDPELVCEVYPDGRWLPVSYHTGSDGVSVEVNAGQVDRPADVHLDVRVHLRNFANKWDAILGSQHYFAAAVDQLNAAAVAACA